MPVLSTEKVIRTVPIGDTHVSLIVPVHNEAKAIVPFLEAASKVLSDNSLNISYDVVFVNDGSQDETERLIEQKIDEGAAIRRSSTFQTTTRAWMRRMTRWSRLMPLFRKRCIAPILPH